MKADQKKEAIAEKFPKPEITKANDSGYRPKDSVMKTKTKSLYDAKNKRVDTVDVELRKLHIGGEVIILHKGVNLTKDQIKLFDKDAKAYYLEAVKGE